MRCCCRRLASIGDGIRLHRPGGLRRVFCTFHLPELAGWVLEIPTSKNLTEGRVIRSVRYGRRHRPQLQHLFVPCQWERDQLRESPSRPRPPGLLLLPPMTPSPDWAQTPNHPSPPSVQFSNSCSAFDRSIISLFKQRQAHQLFERERGKQMMGPASTVSLPESLEQARIHSLPPSAYYISNFISEEEERHILEKVWRRREANSATLDLPC